MNRIDVGNELVSFRKAMKPRWPLLAALLPLIPFFLCFKDIRRLFWFGDELHQLWLIQVSGIGGWVGSTFAENYVPLFKLLWLWSVELFNGSYLGMICLLWATHILNLFLFGIILSLVEIGPWSIFAILALVGLPWSLIESLGWSVQWSALLALTFFLFGALHVTVLSLNFDIKSSSQKLFSIILIVLCALCSCLCFSRGVLCAALLGFYSLLSFWRRGKVLALGLSLACVGAAGAVASVIFANSPGNHHQVGGISMSTLQSMAGFGLSYFLLNPFQRLLRIELVTNELTVLLGALKCLCLLVAFLTRKSLPSALKVFLLVLLCFDLGNAALLALGRYHTGVQFAISSRYQYESLFCFIPFLILSISSLFQRMRWRFEWSANEEARMPLIFLSVLISAAGLWVAWPWPAEMRTWSVWRGIDGRQFLGIDARRRNKKLPADIQSVQNDQGKMQWIGIPGFMHEEVVKELVKHYNLH